MTPALIILYMAITSRMAGGGLGAKYLDRKGFKEGVMPFGLTWLPEAFFALPFGYAGAVGIGQVTGADFAPPIAFVLCALWSFLWMQTATQPGFKLEYDEDKTLIPYVNFIARIVGVKPHTIAYMHVWNAVKGFLIGLPAGGIPLAVLWPLGYEIGERCNSHAVKELASGAGAGLAVVAALYMT